MDINTNKNYTVNQISSQKPNVKRSYNKLVGYIANSMNAGHNRAIAWKQVMAGERHKEYRIGMKIKTLTPLTPPYQQLKCTIRSYFVPNSRIWENAEKYTAQKGGSAEIKINEIPNTGGKTLPIIYEDISQVGGTNIVNTTYWRNAFISSYLPRMGEMKSDLGENVEITLPKISILPLRGRVAIFNDMERNKEYTAEITEYKSDTVSKAEWDSYLPAKNSSSRALESDYYNMRAKRANSYYSNYRTEIQGFEESYPPSNMSADQALITWSSWEHKIAEARSQAENAQANDWDIIAKIRGSKVALQGKVQLIGENTFNLNYASVTQNAYNDAAENINFKALGQQGSYSYTEIQVPCYAGFEAVEEGYIHIIATVWAESVFEQGIDRLELNVTPLDQYRPDLLEEKQDVLYEIEAGTKNIRNMSNQMEVTGFKRKYSEYFKLPNIISGDMTNEGYYEGEIGLQGEQFSGTTEILSQKSYQFFEDDKNYTRDNSGTVVAKKQWLDYSDLLVNKNLAVMNSIQFSEAPNGECAITVLGQHQVFLVGKAILEADMPIDEAIKNNYTTWGEH